MSSHVRVAIVNDYEIVVAGIAAVLEPFSDRISVVELDSGMPVVGDVDVVLYDSFGQVQGGDVDVARLMAGGSGRLVIFSWNTEPELVEASLAAGAAGYIPKGIPAKELVDLIEAVHRGERVLPSNVATPESDDFGRWREYGATHVGFVTMNVGLKGPDAHIDAIRRFKAAVDGA